MLPQTEEEIAKRYLHVPYVFFSARFLLCCVRAALHLMHLTLEKKYFNRWGLLCQLHDCAKSLDANEMRIKRLMRNACREFPGLENVLLKQPLSRTHQHINDRATRATRENPTKGRRGSTAAPARTSTKVAFGRGIPRADAPAFVAVTAQQHREETTVQLHPAIEPHISHLFPEHAELSKDDTFARPSNHRTRRSSAKHEVAGPVRKASAENKLSQGSKFVTERGASLERPSSAGKQSIQESSRKFDVLRTATDDDAGLLAGEHHGHMSVHHDPGRASTKPPRPATSDSKLRMRQLLKWQVGVYRVLVYVWIIFFFMCACMLSYICATFTRALSCV